VNEIGAMGLFQVMPDTLAAVAPGYMGRGSTRSEFLEDAGDAAKDTVFDQED
jgi:hypothetical protein